LWQARGVYLPGEEKPEGFVRVPNQKWELYLNVEEQNTDQLSIFE
jgi:hypothetical protein